MAQTSDNRPLTKAEKKEGKKRKKKISVQDVRVLYEKSTFQKTQIASIESEISILEPKFLLRMITLTSCKNR